MNKTWNVTIFIEEDDFAASARARLTGGNALGHLVGSGRCRVTPTAVQDAGQRAVVSALEDLSHQLNQFVLPKYAGDLPRPAPARAKIASRQPGAVPRGLLSSVFPSSKQSA